MLHVEVLTSLYLFSICTLIFIQIKRYTVLSLKFYGEVRSELS